MSEYEKLTPPIVVPCLDSDKRQWVSLSDKSGPRAVSHRHRSQRHLDYTL